MGGAAGLGASGGSAGAGVGGVGGSGGAGAAVGCQNPVTPCETCTCQKCTAENEACAMVPQCVAIRDCGKTNKCTGVDCYYNATTMQNGPCTQVIDDNGGPLGMPANIAGMLGACVVNQGCPCT